MLIRCLSTLSLLGCQGKPAEPQAQTSIEVRDGSGAITAQLRPGHPCRATIGPIEMIIGGRPLVSQSGDVRWSGETAAAVTTLSRDGALVARVSPVGDPAKASVVDPEGIAIARIAVDHDTAIVSNAGGQVIRHLAVKAGAISVDQPALAVSGTHDLVLAALLSAPELLPEIRMLAACERVLVAKEP